MNRSLRISSRCGSRVIKMTISRYIYVYVIFIMVYSPSWTFYMHYVWRWAMNILCVLCVRNSSLKPRRRTKCIRRSRVKRWRRRKQKRRWRIKIQNQNQRTKRASRWLEISNRRKSSCCFETEQFELWRLVGIIRVRDGINGTSLSCNDHALISIDVGSALDSVHRDKYIQFIRYAVTAVVEPSVGHRHSIFLNVTAHRLIH